MSIISDGYREKEKVLVTFRLVLFSILIIIVSEMIALSAVTWSFLESATSSFSFIKTSSDNRARDTIVSLAKAAEIRMNPKGFKDLDLTFQRLKDVVSEDVDGFRIQEVVLVSPKGVVLASSDESVSSTPITRREVSEKFTSDVYTRAFRMRKWQYPDPILLDEGMIQGDSESSTWLVASLTPLIDRFFPEAKESIGLVSSAVYHETKLDVVAVVHLVYKRGNFSLFLIKQKEIYNWMLITYGIVALIVSFLLIVVYLIISFFNNKNSKLDTNRIPQNLPDPPFIEKVRVREEAVSQLEEAQPQDTPTFSQVSEFSTARHEPVKESVVTSVATQIKNVSKTEEISTHVDPPRINQQAPISNKKIVVDAIYLGEYGD
ncbi:MAG: hypothetical protein JJT78_07325 [Leptospira sp.]|nr:hypothetical protein [Leptospira sp.]